ncbi:TPA: hypothetical protein ACIVHT_004820, partial [Salmonella enterica subsp. enterica serovar Birkenhead]
GGVVPYSTKNVIRTEYMVFSITSRSGDSASPVSARHFRLSGSSVLKRQAARGELYAGAVLHSLLKGWLQEYGGPGGQDE